MPTDVCSSDLTFSSPRAGSWMGSWNFVDSETAVSPSVPSHTATGSPMASQVEKDAGDGCVHAALDSGITTFDTADAYANTEPRRSSATPSPASAASRSRSSPRSTGRPAPAATTTGARPQAHPRVDQRLAGAPADRLRRPLPGAPLRRRDAAGRDDAGLRRRRPPGQGALHRRVGVERRADPQGHELAQKLGIQLISNQPQYSMLWRVIEQEVVPAGRVRPVADRLVAHRAGRADRQVQAGPGAAAGSRATDEKGGANIIRRFLTDEVLDGGAGARADRRRSRPVDGAARRGVGAAEPERRLGDHRGLAARAGLDNVKAAGVTLEPAVMKRIDDILADFIERDPSKTG